MKHITKIGILTCLFAATTIHAQDFEWAKSFGGTSNDFGRSISVDALGNIYTTGYFQGTVDFDPGAGTSNLTSAGGSDIFIQKMDASGNLLWAKSFGGTSNDFSRSISVGALGYIYTIGSFQGTVDFDPGAGTSNLISVGNQDVFVQKMDASGNLLWAKSFGGTSNDYGQSISVDALGNVYTTGAFRETVDFDPGAGTSNLTSAGGPDIFVQKMDASGNLLWAKSFGGTSDDYGQSISVDTLGNVYTTGSFEGTVDFDPGAGTSNLTSAGVYDIFVQKMDASGNFLWAKSFGGTSYDSGESISLDALGNIYTTGVFEGTVDFDPGAGTSNLTSAGISDIFIQKMDASGNLLWVKSFGGTTNDFGRSISVGALGYIYTTGSFEGTIDFDPGAGTFNLASAGGYDVFVQKMDASGNFLWAKSFGGTSYDSGESISLDALGNVYTTGYFQGTVDFDPGAGTSNLTSAGGSDIFVQKMSPCIPTTGTDVQTACGSYIWIDGVNYTASNSTATFNLVCGAANGCDSLVTLDLTINNVSDLTTTTSGITISANNTSATYAWLDCDNNYAVITGETNQSYIPSSNGNYAVELTENGCVDTSACAVITLVGIIENNFENQLRVYPNPTDGNFFIDLGMNYETTNVRLTDLNGKLIQSNSYNDSQFLHLKLEVPAGVYLLVIESAEKKAVIRLVKK
jgi:hypothetical protein